MKIIIASTSTVYGGHYLDYLKPDLEKHFKNVSEIIFIPYARPSGLTHEAYTAVAQKFFKQLDISVRGIHEFDNPVQAIEQAQGIFTGGGNTFLLVKQLYDLKLWQVLKEAISKGTPYLGTSAGSNITGQTMQTTNDMPIVMVPSYETLGIFPFNINPHYLDPKPELLQHMGETRDTRLKEYLHFNDTPVVALREGSWIAANKDVWELKGNFPARIYFDLNNIKEVNSETDLKPLFIKQL